MSTHKHIDKICLVAALLALILCALFMNGEALGIQQLPNAMGYETRLFDTSQVHTIDIRMDDWDSFIETCESEEYAACSVVIDGETYHNVGIRAKGNTSLSTVSSMDSDRYSFKIEFDQYDSSNRYHGLDKLSLNNLIQDATMMKDYLTYQMMGAFGASAPLCSYAYITVNGEDWGLYLAVEAIEDSFLQRNYGSDYGELYKPDSMNLGGGRGNGLDFNMENVGNVKRDEAAGAPPEAMSERATFPEMPENFDPSTIFGGGENGFTPAAVSEDKHPNKMGGGMGSEETKLQYIDDDSDSYSTIFSSAKTSITQADQTRLIASLKALNAGESIENVVDIDQVLRYFVVHNFVVNGDSYTGSMVHNYYLYEEDGTLSMLPWDYNLAFGTFQGRDANSAVNDPIDTPLSVDGSGDRPMTDWIFRSEEYSQLYHQYFAQFLEQTEFAALIDKTAALIAPYVENDPTKFYTTEEFETGVAALREFCLLREESVLGQLKGTIPSTAEGQAGDNSTLIDASHITLSDMGSMNMGGIVPGSRPDNLSNLPEGSRTPPSSSDSPTGQPQPPSAPKGSFDSEKADNLAMSPPQNTPSQDPIPEDTGGLHAFVPPQTKDDRTSALSDTGQSTADNPALRLIALSAVILLFGLCAAKLYRR